MKAVVQTEFGAAEVLRFSERPDPVPRPGWTVVRLQAAALNWHDVLVRQGRYSSPLPHTPGADGAGVDLSTGQEVVVLPSLMWGEREAAPSPGWEILGDHRPGTYAELVEVPLDCVAPKPAGLDWRQAAALPLVGVTTYRALFTRARLQRGESVLVLGAGGGVATMAVSLAAAMGAHVTVTSSSQAKIEAAQQLGARDGVRYDVGNDWVGDALVANGGQGYDVVLDSVGTWADSVRAVRPGGRVVVLGASRGDEALLDVRGFYFGQYDLLGTTMGSPRDFAALVDFMAERRVPPPVIDRSFDLSQAAAAHDYLESGAGFGKVVLDIS